MGTNTESHPVDKPSGVLSLIPYPDLQLTSHSAWVHSSLPVPSSCRSSNTQAHPGAQPPLMVPLLKIICLLFLAALGFCSCLRAFCSCREQELLFLGGAGFRSCVWKDLLLHCMWDLPGPGIEPVSPALAGGFLTTGPPGKPYDSDFIMFGLAISLLFFLSVWPCI